MKTCEMVVDWTVTSEGERGDEITCGKPATHTIDGVPACPECAEADWVEDDGLDVRPITPPDPYDTCLRCGSWHYTHAYSDLALRKGCRNFVPRPPGAKE